MIQSLDKQLQVVIRALSDVVAPALTDGEKHVAEQLHLSIATLGFVLKRLPEARRFARHELDSYLALADALLTATKGELAEPGLALDRYVAEGRATLASAEADVADIELATRRLREAVTRLADAARETGHRRQVETLILDNSDAIVAQARQWCAPFGFELKPQTLPQPAW